MSLQKGPWYTHTHTPCLFVLSDFQNRISVCVSGNHYLACLPLLPKNQEAPHESCHHLCSSLVLLLSFHSSYTYILSLSLSLLWPVLASVLICLFVLDDTTPTFPRLTLFPNEQHCKSAGGISLGLDGNQEVIVWFGGCVSFTRLIHHHRARIPERLQSWSLAPLLGGPDAGRPLQEVMESGDRKEPLGCIPLMNSTLSLGPRATERLT